MRTPLTRRALLALGALPRGPVWGHGGLGPVQPPRPVPPLPLTLHDGRRSTLPTLLHGRVTALQLMYTGCGSTCPVQGAVFAALQPLVLGRVAGAQLLSLSIAPLADDAAALAAWRLRFGAAPDWQAAAPPVAQAELMLDFVAGRPSRPGGDRHNAQVHLFDRRGRLAWQMAEYAAPADLAAAMRALAGA